VDEKELRSAIEADMECIKPLTDPDNIISFGFAPVATSDIDYKEPPDKYTHININKEFKSHDEAIQYMWDQFIQVKDGKSKLYWRRYPSVTEERLFELDDTILYGRMRFTLES